MEHHSIAIDGPSGAGKSTLAKMLAERLGYLYVDTGAIYRTVALKAQRLGVDLDQEEQVSALLGKIQVRMAYESDGLQHMYLDGEDVTQAIRVHAVSQWTSLVAALPPVRAFLLDYQRQLAREHSVVMDGRDIGTVVLPQADVKIFLTASAEIRARRRLLELEQRGQQADYETILHDVKQRDLQDSSRAIAPLRQAEDAVRLDTSELTLEGSLLAMEEIVKEKLGHEN